MTTYREVMLAALRSWRWAVVLAGVALLTLLPSLVGRAPVPASGLSARALLARIVHSGTVPHSGYAESSGGLALPVSGQLNSLTELLGGHTQQRVWWRGPDDWRVDTVTATGETDLHQSAEGAFSWDYESNRVTVLTGPEARIRLPAARDLLPSELGRRLLGGATAAEVSRIGNRRVAGRPTAGLRLRPSAPQSSIDRVEVWADEATGVPLQVDAYARGGSRPSMAATFLTYSPVVPSAATTRFDVPPGARIRGSDRVDLLRYIDLQDQVNLPGILAFAIRNDTVLGGGSVGVYGRGVTQFVVLRLPDQAAYTLREQLDPSRAVDQAKRVTLAVGPLSLLLTPPDREGHTFLLVGTVTLAGLGQAADDLARQRGAG